MQWTVGDIWVFVCVFVYLHDNTSKCSWGRRTWYTSWCHLLCFGGRERSKIRFTGSESGGSATMCSVHFGWVHYSSYCQCRSVFSQIRWLVWVIYADKLLFVGRSRFFVPAITYVSDVVAIKLIFLQAKRCFQMVCCSINIHDGQHLIFLLSLPGVVFMDQHLSVCLVCLFVCLLAG